MFNKLKFIGAAVLCTVMLSGCSSRFSPIDGRIYYTVVELGSSRIEYTDPEGTVCHYVVGAMPESTSADSSCVSEYESKSSDDPKNAKQAMHPTVSSGGGLMAYVCDQNNVRVINLLTGKEDYEVASEEAITDPAFNSDSTPKLAYMRIHENSYVSIFAKDNGKAPVEVVKSKRLGPPSWSNFGNKVYVSYKDAKDNYCLYEIEADGSGKMKELIKGASECCMAPVGGKLAVIIDGDLWVYDLITKKNIQLVNQKGCSSPSWNPKGDQLAFVKDSKVFTIGLEGGEPKQITFTNALIMDVCWAKGL